MKNKAAAFKLLGVCILLFMSVTISKAQIIVKGNLISINHESSVAIGTVSQVRGANPAQLEYIGYQLTFGLYANSGLDVNPVQPGDVYEASCLVSRNGVITIVEVTCYKLGGGIKRWRPAKQV